jgi:hypothetical protein
MNDVEQRYLSVLRVSAHGPKTIDNAISDELGGYSARIVEESSSVTDDDGTEEIVAYMVDIDEPDDHTLRVWMVAVRGLGGHTVIVSGPLSTITPLSSIPEVE